MKRTFALILLLSFLIPACTTPQTGIPLGKTPLPYPDTPSPSTVNAPIVENPALVFIDFINSLDGWGVTETQIVRTTDGGSTWYNVSPPTVDETGYSVSFHALDSTTAWMQKPDFDNFPNSGVLYRTRDGGLTWENSNTPFSGGDMQFLDPDNGWALADLGVAAGSNAVAVYQTSDAGNTWTRKFINDPNNPNAQESLPLGGLKSGIAPRDMQTAWVYGVTYYSGTIYLFRTDDAGVSWTPVELQLPSGAESYELGIDQDQMKFVSPTDGFLSVRFTGESYLSAIYVTNDGGNTWSLTPTLIPDGGSAVFMPVNSAVIYNGQQFYVTNDTAQSWKNVPPDVSFGDTFAIMDFVDVNTGWVLTFDQTNHRSLYRSTNGGGTWVPVAP